MAKKRNKMSESELSALLDGQIADAVSYEESELAPLRDKALKYRDGIMDDLPAEEGKSSVVSMDTNDTIAWIMPGWMRIFAGSDKMVEFEPQGPEDEEYVDQATDYINYLWWKECGGYKLLLTGLDDGAGLGNGVYMHWWDRTPEHKVETFSGLSDDAFTLLVSDDDVEVLEHSEYADPQAPLGITGPEAPVGPVPAPELPGSGLEGPGVAGALIPAGSAPDAIQPVGLGASGLGAPALLHDVKIKRTTRKGRLRIEAVPPEELLIPRDAKAIDEDISGIGRERTPTRSQLIKEGYDRTVVEELPAWSDTVDDTAKSARNSNRSWEGNSNPDKSMEKVKIYEWWPLVDYDGDGVAERRFVVIGDRTQNNESRKILKNEEWGDDLAFTDIVPYPVAHRRRGRSQFDNTQDIQRVKTALFRAVMNNTYSVNEPMIEAVLSQVNNPDALINRELNGVIDVKQLGVIQPHVTPPIFDKVFPVIEYWDGVKQGRTGVGRQTMGLDPDALQNETAEAVRDGRAASETQTEFGARNMAEIGFKRLFRCILRLVIKNQDKPKVIKLRNKWVEFDPRPWNADMDCTVNVGLGAGSKDRDMVMLQAIAGKQEMILQTLGPDNPICSLDQYRATLAEMVTVGGLKSAEKYFKEVTPEAIQQWMQAKSQQPDPKMLELQAKQEADAQKSQMDAQFKERELQMKAEMENVQARADMAVKEREVAFAERLETMKFEFTRELEMLRYRLDEQKARREEARRDREFEANLRFKTQDQQVAHHFKQQDFDMKSRAQQNTPAE